MKKKYKRLVIIIISTLLLYILPLLPVGFREKTVIVVRVESVDNTYKELSNRGVTFINKPDDIPGWGSRVAF